MFKEILCKNDNIVLSTKNSPQGQEYQLSQPLMNHGGSSHCAQKEMVEPQGSWEGKISMFSL